MLFPLLVRSPCFLLSRSECLIPRLVGQFLLLPLSCNLHPLTSVTASANQGAPGGDPFSFPVKLVHLTQDLNYWFLFLRPVPLLQHSTSFSFQAIPGSSADHPREPLAYSGCSGKCYLADQPPAASSDPGCLLCCIVKPHSATFSTSFSGLLYWSYPGRTPFQIK